MLNDAAETGPNEFIKLITENCGEHSIEPVFIGYKRLMSRTKSFKLFLNIKN